MLTTVSMRAVTTAVGRSARRVRPASGVASVAAASSAACLHTSAAAHATVRPTDAAVEAAVKERRNPDGWGPWASRTLPLESLTDTPRVHTRPPDRVVKAPLRYSRLRDDWPNSQHVQFELRAAVIVERWPKIMKEEPKWKIDYHKHFEPLRKAKRSRHAVPTELAAKEEAKEAPVEVRPTDLLTEADRINDLHATHRCLQDTLFLVVKRKGTDVWAFPDAAVLFDVRGGGKDDPALKAAAAAAAAAQAKGMTAVSIAAPAGSPKSKSKSGAGVSLRSVAQTALHNTVGKDAAIYFMGNAPLAVHRTIQDEEKWKQAVAKEKEATVNKMINSNSNNNTAPAAAASSPPSVLPSSPPYVAGRKTFFMHALYMDGEIRLQNARDFEDFAWVKREELPNYLEKGQAELLSKVLLDFSPSNSNATK